MTIDHLCRVTACVRVEHLEMVTQQENYRRAREAATHCRNGHPYNRGVVGTGKIRCEICWVANRTRNEAARAARARAARQPRELMPIPHGTANGYDAHNRRDIPIPEGDPCGCRAAHNARARMHKRNRRLRQLAAERAA